MQKFDVWVYLPTEKDPEEIFTGTYEGYISEISTAILTLYPSAVGIFIQPETPE